MKTAIRRGLGICVLLATAVASSGCIAAAVAVGAGAGVGTYAYVEGKLTDDLAATVPQVVTATNAAFHDLQMTVISSAASAVDGEVIARTAQDKRIKVEISSTSAAVSHISIRVGFWGDEEMSVRVLDAIKARLPAPRNAANNAPAPVY